MEGFFTHLKKDVFGSALSLEQMGRNINFQIENNYTPHESKIKPPFNINRKSSKTSNNSVAYDFMKKQFIEMFKIEGNVLFGFVIKTSPIIDYDSHYAGHIFKIDKMSDTINKTQTQNCKVAIICDNYISIMTDYLFI